MDYTELKMQDYLQTNKFSVDQAKTIYIWRTRMANLQVSFQLVCNILPAKGGTSLEILS